MLKLDPESFFENPDATALLVIDMQHDFVDPSAPLSTPGATAIIPTIASIADSCRNRQIPVIYTREMHRAGLADFGIEGHFEPLHCVESSRGSEIIAELRPLSGDYVVAAKRRYDAFIGTELDLLLRGLKIENLLVVGVCTDICVMSTVFHARNLDYRCFVVTDAVDGTSQQRHDAALLCLSHVWAFLGTSDDAAEIFKLDLVR